MKAITCIRNARLRGKEFLFDIHLDHDGTIAKIEPATGATGTPDEIDAAGGLVIPSLIDAHLHLDLAYSLDIVSANKSGTLTEAILHWSAAKKTMTAESVKVRALRAIREEVSCGVGFIRTHVDVGSAAGMRLCEGVLAAREQTKELVGIQVVVFPQDGILKDRGAYEQMRAGLEMGCDLVGGIAHNERTDDDSKRHIDMLFDLADEFDCDIDCHIDETDNPESKCIEVMASKAVERRRRNRVTGSHVCALSSYNDVHASKVIGLIAEAGMNVVTNPGVNLHLQGRFDRYPKRRGLTRVTELLEAKVNVCAGQDCIKDPFYPLGTGNMFEAGHLLIHADHLSQPEQIEQVADMITVNPARALRLENYGTDPGCQADLVVLPVESMHEAFRLRVKPTAVLKRGKLVSP
ncbi:MAG: amidohydrolase family protein [Phycisphaerae bacterium]|nr:amidohydrolase family protein [Phycisphaerae bacterium]